MSVSITQGNPDQVPRGDLIRVASIRKSLHLYSFSGSILPRLGALATVCAAIGSAQAVPVSGTWSSGGFDTIVFTVAAPSTVDRIYTSGYGDPTFSLFNNAGAQLIANDDSLGLYSHRTQNQQRHTGSHWAATACLNPARWRWPAARALRACR